MAKKAVVSEEISIVPIDTARIDYCIIGKTPLILNRVANKAEQELLHPKGKKTAADKSGSLKHDPVSEFRSSPYVLPMEDEPTYLAALAVWFKKALAGAALDIPGAKKAQIGRLVVAEGQRIPLYGIPKLHMAITRNADMNRTPDVRTRCIVPEWAVFLTITHAVPILRAATISNLLSAGGQTQGVGDWRPEKGSGNYGQFLIAKSDDEDFRRIVETGGRAVQKRAMQEAEAYDDETDELLSWFLDESTERGYGPTVRGVA